jgi:hypothetical protein
MEQSTNSLIDEAVKLELNMAKLYSIFSEYIDEDRSFWNRLELEEKNHAALLRTAKEFVSFNRFPKNLIPDDLEVLVQSNNKAREAMDEFIASPGRNKAFSLAIELEESAGEIHFQYFMEKEANDNIVKIFQRLNLEDKNHAERIILYWKEVVQKL